MLTVQSCNHSFCPPHRHTTSHNCTPTSSRTSTPIPSTSTSSNTDAASASKSAMSRLLAKKASTPSSTSTSKPSRPVAPTAKVASASHTSTSAEGQSDQVEKPLDARAAAVAAAMRRAGDKAKGSVQAPIAKHKTDK